MRRRDFLKTTSGAAAAALTMRLGGTANASIAGVDPVAAKKEYLLSIMPSRQQVQDFLAGCQGPEDLSRNQGWLFDSNLGWVLCDSIRGRSVDGSKGFYSYEEDGARKVINAAGRPCRIHTYGNSFTHCDQVSDGETWQEYLAAHIQEPIRNYGVGGYSVYQAYRRMLRVEKANSDDYIILNIWDDDHYRNLDSWRSIRTGRRTSAGYTLPHLRVNVQQDHCEQVENVCRKPEDLYKLCDQESVWQMFKDDPILHVVWVLRQGKGISPESVTSIARSLGVSVGAFEGLEPQQQARQIRTEAALYATKNVVTWTERFARENDKKLMIILSFSQSNIAKDLEGQPRFDQSFVDWLEDKTYPVVDMRDYFRADFESYRGKANEYLRRYYIGHHTPAGNFFTAWAIKSQVVKWLKPQPRPYSR